jgi:hypothetical protein
LKILIMGERLWRNTSVTMGSHKAAKIEVLPNMEGILAEFDEGDRPDIAPTGKGDLRVWTSEGVADLPLPLANRLRVQGTCPSSRASAATR